LSINDPIYKYAYEKITSLYSSLNIINNPLIVIVRLTKEEFSLNNFKRRLPEEDFIDMTSTSQEYFVNRSIDLIDTNSKDIIEIEDYELYNIDCKMSSDEVILTFLVINKEDFEHPFCKEILETIKVNGIYNNLEKHILNYSGEQLLKRTYESFINIEYDKIKLFQFFHEISLLNYEGNENNGGILFCLEDKERYLEDEIRLIDPIPLDKSYYKKVRKLLETCNNNMYLLSNGVVISGICKLKDGAKLPLNSFKVSFQGSGTWKLSILNFENRLKDIMMVNHGTCRIPNGPILKSEFEEKFKNSFSSDIDYLQYDLNEVWKYIDYAQKQKHGTMLVITKDAQLEANRLSKQSFNIIKTKGLSSNIVLGLTSIDGALIIDPRGYCYAIGAILDGIVESSLGDISRGARYNAALKYLFSNKTSSCLVIIISEDGYGDIKTKDDLENLDLKVRELYHQHILKLLNSKDIEIVKKAYDEYVDFSNLFAKLLGAEVMAIYAKQHALQNKDFPAVAEYESIQNNNRLFLSEKIAMYEAFHNKVIFHYQYD
jgi:hypothetical protein